MANTETTRTQGGSPSAPPIVTLLAERWWALALRGAAAIIFGVLTFVAPGASLLALVILFGAYAIVNGVINLGLAVRSASGEARWGSLAFESVVSIAAGIVAFIWPGITALALLVVIAAWAIVTGVAQVVAAIRLRRTIKGEWLLALAGLLSIAFGVLCLAAPGAGALAVTLWIGAYALLFGGVMLALGLRLRAWHRRETGHRVPPAGVPAHA
jgi:uncharacterized membrane protein HdeD (DUF308 family)